MHVCFIDRKRENAIWTLMDHIAQRLIAGGDQVSYVRFDDGLHAGDVAVPDGASVHDIFVGRKRFPWQVWRQERQFADGFRRWLTDNQPDVVHTNFCLPGNVGRRMARATNVPAIITTYHELFGSMNTYLKWSTRRTERYCDQLVYISKTVAESYGEGVGSWQLAVDREEEGVGSGELAVGREEEVGSGELAVGREEEEVGSGELTVGREEEGVGSWQLAVGREEEGVGSWRLAGQKKELAVGSWQLAVGSGKHRLIYNGIDIARIESFAAEAGAVVPQQLISVGRLVPEKGHALIVRALPQLRQRFPDVTLLLVGEGPAKADLVSLADQLGVADRVEFRGWVPQADAIAEMARSHCVIMPSRAVQEGFGLALAEAMLTGRPVVASDIPVFREVAADSGVRYFAEDDFEQLADQIGEVLSEPCSSNAQANAAAQRVKENFSSHLMARRYFDLYRHLMNSKESNYPSHHKNDPTRVEEI